MTLLTQLKSGLKKARPSIAEDARAAVRKLGGTASTRRVLNTLYGHLSYAAKAELHSRFSDLYRGTSHLVEGGHWTVPFLDRLLIIPIKPERAWLDWDACLSLLGHETELKSTYEAILQKGPRPDLFLDVGTNYGGHSLLFASAGVECMSFEPNDVCHDYIAEVARLNGVTIPLFGYALGDSEGSAELCFPKGEAWLGTVDPDVRDQLGDRASLESKTVRVTTLDQVVVRDPACRILLKIDVEGAELGVLKGARRILDMHRPVVLFESFPDPGKRSELLRYFDESKYRIARLPWDAVSEPAWIDGQTFLNDPAGNFMAQAR